MDRDLRTPLRRAAAAGAALVAAGYLLIGFNVVTVIEGQGPGLGTPMLIAGVLFALLAAGLALMEKRFVPVAGAGLLVLVLVGYFVISAERTPAFEAWGLAIKAVQVALLVALGYLALGARAAARPAAPVG